MKTSTFQSNGIFAGLILPPYTSRFNLLNGNTTKITYFGLIPLFSGNPLVIEKIGVWKN
jgi:hypothetical protein